MSPWWSKSSAKESKNKTNGGGIFGFIKRKLTSPSSSILVAQTQNFTERPHAHRQPLPENLSDMGRVDMRRRSSRNPRSIRGSSPLVLFPVPNHAQNGHEQTDVEGDLATDSVFTESDSDSDEGYSRPLSPQVSTYITGNETFTNSPSSFTFVTRKKREKLKPVRACVNNQMLPTSPKRLPLSQHVANLQIPQSGGYFSSHDSSMPSPSKSPMRVSGPEPTPTADFWAMRPYADTDFIGPGLCLSPGSGSGSGHNSSHNSVGTDMAGQSFLQDNSYSSECSPMPSPRMTSPGPSSRIQSGPVTPLHPWAGKSNMDISDHVVHGKQPAHQLPLPPPAMSNTGPYSPSYTTRTTPTIPKSPGRVDIPANQVSRWIKGKLLGSGTYADVYLGFNSERGEMCAMKEVTLFSDDARSIESAQQLAQEIKLLSRLRHPNIVQYYGSETVDDKLYIYLEYVSGGSIRNLLQEYGPFGETAIRNYTRQILLGLAYLHARNTVHRDIKGANILVEPDGCIKLADFGMAKHISGPSSSLSFKGSPYWMAPEIINNSSNGFNLAVDIWSLGCTVLEMATSKPPLSQYQEVAALFKIVNTNDILAMPHHLSDDCKDFVLQCLQSAPSRRPSAAQLLDHPFVKQDVGQASEVVSIPHSKGHMPHNKLIPVSHMGNPLSPTRTGQNMNRSLSPSPISSPRTIMGSPTPLTGAVGGGAHPFYHQAQKSYDSEFTTLTSTSTSRSPIKSVLVDRRREGR